MKRWSLLLCLVFVGFGLGAFAEESWPEKKSDARGDSEANRHDKQFTVLGQLTGLSWIFLIPNIACTIKNRTRQK